MHLQFAQQDETTLRQVGRGRGGAAIDRSAQAGGPLGAMVVPHREGWAIQPWQPPHRGTERRAGAIMPIKPWIDSPLRNPFPDIIAGAWPIQHFQPPAGRHNARSRAGGIMPIVTGTDAIFIPSTPTWPMAEPRSQFPNSQANPAAAMPTYNAGPQVGAISTQPGITSPMLLKATPGTLFSITLAVAGSVAGSVHDCAAIADATVANQIALIPTSGGPIFPFEWPCQVGIVVKPGAGQTLAAKWF